jgi:hypothetical protein
MRIRALTLFILLALSIYPASASEKKIRFAGTAGGVVQNDLLIAPGITGGAGVAIAYPVSAKDRPINVELGITNWYNIFPAENAIMHTLRFGFGVRVFLNAFESLRPYFTHDICSHAVWISDRTGYAATFGILLGLGLDIPLEKQRGDRETSSLFFDVSFNTFTLASFAGTPEEVRFFSASVGYSLLIPQKNRQTTSKSH